MQTFTPPSHDCPLCPRLADFRQQNAVFYPDFHNAPVPSFGTLETQLLVVGLAPGLKGANQTGRPFTGDYAGIILYNALRKYGFAAGEYQPEAMEHDSFHLLNCRVTNAVRCVPPANKPEPSEIRQCNRFLQEEIRALPHLKVIITLGQISHKAVIAALGFKQSAYPFGHGNIHTVTPGIALINSYHTSRYNINTGVLTVEMFDRIVQEAKDCIA